MNTDVPRITPVRPHPKESELLNRLAALLSEYSGEMSTATVLGALDYMKAKLIEDMPAWPRE